MTQIEAFKDTFKCNLCNGLLERPIILPCGETICEKDLNTFFNNEEVFQCTHCANEHHKPMQGFPLNKNFQKLLDLQVNQIDLSKNYPKYEECNNMLKQIQENIKETDSIAKDPESFVFDYFEKIINQVDTQREKLIEKINLYSEITIERIKRARDDCILEGGKKDLISADYENMKESVNKMNQELNSFDINDKKIENLIQYLTNARSTALTELKKIQDDLLLNTLHRFEPVNTDDMDTEDLLGSFLSVVFRILIFDQTFF